ncbi:hypothetical protein NX801_04395 [Streptomyces sp. LP05-1]|uniref:Uncharacterized protein n=1 Tax=Streptomyces pyxinae TaxID=2970734 RepID=A0ABT2CBW9_9ACTN|nr:hypothetical protein [Streptomyces sp. LP05-1]MCS0634912.1 hypothetical protein [Streptomyces sp. LP05-1]
MNVRTVATACAVAAGTLLAATATATAAAAPRDTGAATDPGARPGGGVAVIQKDRLTPSTVVAYVFRTGAGRAGSAG